MASSVLKKFNHNFLSLSYRTISKLCSLTDIEREWNETRKVPEHFNFFQDVIKFWAEKEKNVERNGPPAFWYVDKNNNDTKWSFQELVLQTEKTASVLKSCGLERNDRMIVILPKIPEWWLIILASFQTGILSAPGTTQLRSKDILYRINSIGAKCIIADLETSERVDQIVKDCPSLKIKILCSENKAKEDWIDFKTKHQNLSPLEECVKTKIDDPMIIYFTSGSTGYPKAVHHVHENAFASCIFRKYWLDLQPTSLMWSLSDTGWAKTSWGSLLNPWSAGSGNFIHHFPQFDPEMCLNILQNYPITNFCAPPTAYKFLVKKELKNYRLSHLKQCTSGGESLTKDLLVGWKKETGMTIYEVYGQTETALLCSTYHCMNIKAGSMGLPPNGIELTIVNEKYEELPHNEEGEIAIKLKPNYPLGIFREYINDPNKTRDVFKEDYFVTGDRGYKDEDGYFWFMGRNDDIISSSGYRIGPFEVESALQEHPAVKECAVVASPDPLRGEVVKAFIILIEEYREVNKENLIKQLQDHVKNVTSPYKYPRKIEFMEELPKTISGKVQRYKLREKERKENKIF